MPLSAQSQCVGNHRHGAQAHRQSGDHRAEQQASQWIQNAGRHRHAQGVVEKSKTQVLLHVGDGLVGDRPCPHDAAQVAFNKRSEEHTSELQSLMRISYAVFCLKKKKTYNLHYIIINYYINSYVYYTNKLINY